MKELRLQISDELHKRLKKMALEEDATLKRLTTKALEEYVREWEERQKEEASDSRK